MVIDLADWSFSVDITTTEAHTMKCASDHCLCGYCRNYYETVDMPIPLCGPSWLDLVLHWMVPAS